MISDRTIFRGFTEFRQAIEEFHKNVTIADPTVSDFNVHVAGDVAWARFTNYWIAKFKDGKPYGTNNGTVTAGLIKKNGKWLILRFHETPM
jgi:ketosteroid isomerase-like protein